MEPPSSRTGWITVAIASGACAAFNGVFAKLTTTEMTSSWAASVGHILGLGAGNKMFDYLLRSAFFGLNLLFNAIMWGLFTRALTLASSTVRVSVINTSANFLVTAFLGAMIFSEALPGLWWVGAALLVAGSVIIGSRDESTPGGSGSTAASEPAVRPDTPPTQDEFRDDPATKSPTGKNAYAAEDEGSQRKSGDNLELRSVDGRNETE